MRLAKTITDLMVIWDVCLVLGGWTLYLGIGKKRRRAAVNHWRRRGTPP